MDPWLDDIGEDAWLRTTDWRQLVNRSPFQDTHRRRYNLACAGLARRLIPITGDQVPYLDYPHQPGPYTSVYRLIEAIEKFADSQLAREQMEDFQFRLAGHKEVMAVYYRLAGGGDWASVSDACFDLELLGVISPTELCDLLREFLGDCYLDPAILFPPEAVRGHPTDLARQMYDRSDLSRMPELAEALASRPGIHPRLLEHVRQPGPHYRGCWAVDRILGLPVDYIRVDRYS